MAQSTVIPGVASTDNRPSWQAVAAMIDHTLLKPEATQSQVIQLCEEALAYNFCCAFVHQTWASLAVSLLRGSNVRVGVPAGFPHGASLTSVKRFEAEEALRIGASEVDMVLNIGALKSGDRNLVQSDIAGVAHVVHDNGGILKVILETSLLTLDEKLVACQLAVAAGADFVKTSTGFAGGGATVDDVALMRGVVGEKLGVKASGGVRIAADALAVIQAGANRIGTSGGVGIVRDLGAPVVTEPANVSGY
ncbi:MAG: deoxyribose-phosphate aldolase [Acidobacteriales bacterium]|nr:deoxyribose-phosphate aldolase [Terriglobales bacterium]